MNKAFVSNKLSLAICVSLFLTACGGGGSTETKEPTAVIDTSPDRFTLDAITGIALDTWVTSKPFKVAGINAPTAIKITDGEYSVNGSAFTNQSGTIKLGDSISVRAKSKSEHASSHTATLFIGDKQADFIITTLAAPTFNGTQVNVHLDTLHSINGIDSFEREKYITIHSSNVENDWGQNDSHSNNAANALGDDLVFDFIEGHNVYFGRETGSLGWNLRNVRQDDSRPGYVDPASLISRAGDSNWTYDNSQQAKFKNGRQLEDRMAGMIVGGQQHPYWPEGTEITPVAKLAEPKWSFSQTDTANEPLGTATGEYFARYLQNFYRQSSEDAGPPKPKYFEVMNEPLYDLSTDREGETNYVEPLKVFEFHNTVAKEIAKISDNHDILVGGYTIAFPDFDKNNFQRWHDRDKLFIDTSGEYMDFYSIHLYDFPEFKNSERYRRGSNLEATLDMLEQYSQIKLGEIKPIVISEVGSSTHIMVNQDWSPQRDAEKVRSITSMNTQFLERPDTIAKVIPFIPVKAEWGRRIKDDDTSIAYSSRLMIQQFERDGSNNTDWVYSDHIYFYKLWKEVAGKRAVSTSTDLDIQSQVFIDGKTAYVVLTSLEFDDRAIQLNTLGVDNNSLSSVEIKTLGYSEQNTVDYQITNMTELPDNWVLPAEATQIIKLTYSSDINQKESASTIKYYASEYLQAIQAYSPMSFNIDDVNVGSQGYAVLRMGLGRDHGKSLTPKVTINGVTLTVPSDFRGYDQKQGKSKTGRENFFGVIEIPVPYSALQSDNNVQIEFADNGGYVSSMALQVVTSSKKIQYTLN
ncbi:hypothetical protein [Gayadomonas joobiniege]|uniref:hypothetical protein n=1 Tax=Gayadomonas joobiniege TaxID=1234606 RepID=UPI0003815E5A|nr:hypothetical protein [Gayadomonas joobiniege]